MPNDLVVIVTDSRIEAEEMLLAATRLRQEGKLTLEDAVVVEKTEAGHTHVHNTVDLSPGEGAMIAGFWGLLLGTLLAGPAGGVVVGAVTAAGGALLGALLDRGISLEFVRDLERELQAGTAAAVFLTSAEDREAVLAELGRFEGRLLWSNLPREARAAVEDALSGGSEPNEEPGGGEVSDDDA